MRRAAAVLDWSGLKMSVVTKSVHLIGGSHVIAFLRILRSARRRRVVVLSPGVSDAPRVIGPGRRPVLHVVEPS